MATTGGPTKPRMTCPRCHAAVGPGVLLLTPLQSRCDTCNAQLEVSFFPALFRSPTTTEAGEVVSAEEAACFYHQNKQASELCDHCGRFLCSLCSVDWHQEHLCPDCIQHAGLEGGRRHEIAIRTHYDRITLALAVLPTLFIWPTIVTAPVVLCLSVYFWRRPCSFVAKPWHARTRLTIAALFALLQITGWGVVIFLAATGALS